MGACDFQEVYHFNGRDNIWPDMAYNDLCARAREMYGSDPYSGTIATTDGFEMYDDDVHDLGEAEAIVAREVKTRSKYAPALCIKIGEGTLTKSRKVTCSKVLKDSEQIDAAVRDAVEHIIAAKLKPGESIVSYEVIEDATKYKTVVKRASGKRSIKYRVAGATFDTMAQAIEYAKAQSENPVWRGRTMHVEGVAVWDGGSTMVESLPVSRRMKVCAVVGQRSPKAQHTGYIFCGMASC